MIADHLSRLEMTIVKEEGTKSRLKKTSRGWLESRFGASTNLDFQRGID